MIFNLTLWSIPLLIVPGSWIAYRYIPLHRERYLLYGFVLVVAFFLNLFRVTFQNEMADTVKYLLVNFIIMEFFWNCRRFAKGKFFITLTVIALAVYGLQHWRWIGAGPANAWKLWKPAIVSTYQCGHTDYWVKDKDLFDRINPTRLLILSKQFGPLALEKQISMYRTPKGYYQSMFHYKWSKTFEGVRLDIWHNNYVLWTLGEGF